MSSISRGLPPAAPISPPISPIHIYHELIKETKAIARSVHELIKASMAKGSTPVVHLYSPDEVIGETVGASRPCAFVALLHGSTELLAEPHGAPAAAAFVVLYEEV